MKKNARVILEKERIKLKIKQQEYEIKKSFLDLKHRYHPLNVAVRAASDYLTTHRETSATDQIDYADTPVPAAKGIGQLLAQIVGLVQNYFQYADQLQNPPDSQAAPPKSPPEQYIIGKDDK
ncbi:MAG: hypothetical protein IT273_07010 [Chitinophagales bacterium]|nr:hypothetical protein [Chitinophagales bacterium]